eukprot:tig00000632_g2752.t1
MPARASYAQCAFYSYVVSVAGAGPPPRAPPFDPWSYLPGPPVTWWGAALLMGLAAPAAFVALDELAKRHDRRVRCAFPAPGPRPNVNPDPEARPQA